MSKMGRGRCAGCCFRSQSEADGNLYGGVEMGGRWYMTRYPATGWDLAWFNVEPVGGVITPDFAGAAYIEAPDLTYEGEPHFCVGLSGSQYGDGSRVPPGGDSVVWYQLNYVPYSDPSVQPIAALARVFVRDDSISSQIGDPDNTAFELTHCWIIKDDASDPYYWDAEEKLCHYFSASRKTLVGPEHFCLQELRVDGGAKNRWTYWTPGVANANVTEWDNPNVTINTTGWVSLYGDASSFPVVLATQASTIATDGGIQTGYRDLICAIADPATGTATEVNEWTDEGASEGTQHLRVVSDVGGIGGGWPTLTQAHLSIEVNDFGFCGAAGDFAQESPDEIDPYTIYAFSNALNHNPAGRYKCQWGAQTFQRSQDSRFGFGVSVTSSSDPITGVVLKVIAGGSGPTDFPIAGVRGSYRVSAGADGSSAHRIAGVTTNSWCGYSSAQSTVTDYLGTTIDGVGATGHGEIMHAYGGGYLFEKEGEGALGDPLSVPAPTFSDHTTAEPVFRDGNLTWKEDSLGWYLESIPPKIRALVRLPAAIDITPDADAGDWFAWVVSQSHTVQTTPIAFDGALPGWQKAMRVMDGEDEVYVKPQGRYWTDAETVVESPIGALCYAGVDT